jgi:aquaporin NIP
MKAYAAELLGTFMLVFFGTGAVVTNTASNGALGLLGIALVFGLTVLTVIHAIGDISGAHLNPAVTIGLLTSGRTKAATVAPYIVCQVAGGLLASVLLHAIFPKDTGLGATLPGGDTAPMAAFVLEALMTFFLMFVILNVTVGAKEKGITAGIAISSVVVLEILFAGPITGASMNPARSIGPAVVSGQLQHLWVYLAAPVVGAVAAGAVCGWMREPAAVTVAQPAVLVEK